MPIAAPEKRRRLVALLGEDRVRQLEARLKEKEQQLMRMGIGYKGLLTEVLGGKADGAAVGRPLGGATSWEEADSFEEGLEAMDLAHTFAAIISNIVDNEELSAKGKARLVQQAASDLEDRLAGVSEKQGGRSPAYAYVQDLLGPGRTVGQKQGDVAEGTWDADAEEKKVRRWASSDGSGDPDKINWSKYGRAFAVIKGEGNKLGDFGFLHHVVRDGKLVLHRQGVQAAWGAARGARAGQPNAEAQGHLQPHRETLGMEEEAEKSYGGDFMAAAAAPYVHEAIRQGAVQG